MTIRKKIEAKAAELEALNVEIQKGNIEAAEKSSEVRGEIDALEKALKSAEETEKKLKSLAEVKKPGTQEEKNMNAKTIGEHFAESLKGVKLESKFDFAAPEFKSASNTVASGEGYNIASNKTSYEVVENGRHPLLVRRLFGAETLETASYSYFTEGAVGTAPASVNEGASKTAVTYDPASLKTVNLSKIAGYIKETDEFKSDYAFLASAINGRLLYDLGASTESFLVSTLLGTSGVQSDTTSWDSSTTVTGLADLVLDAAMDVQSESGKAADAILIHPTDWYALRIGKDGSSRYYGGGYFSDGQVKEIWGIPAIVTTAVNAGTIVVGSFKLGATVLSKGGVSVEMTNTDQDDFIKNLMTIRAEERLALAVRIPVAFKKLVKTTASV